MPDSLEYHALRVGEIACERLHRREVDCRVLRSPDEQGADLRQFREQAVKLFQVCPPSFDNAEGVVKQSGSLQRSLVAREAVRRNLVAGAEHASVPVRILPRKTLERGAR